jgi:hypothetical protein
MKTIAFVKNFVLNSIDDFGAKTSRTCARVDARPSISTPANYIMYPIKGYMGHIHECVNSYQSGMNLSIASLQSEKKPAEEG